MIEMINRGLIQDPAVQAEFEHLISRLRGFLSQSFDADGQLIVADPNLAVIPVGGWIPYGGTTAPTGWLLCDGSQVSRTTYKSLYDVIGTMYGAGDGSTTFNVPDFRGRFVLGKAAAGTGSTLGSTGGSIDHTHTGPSHTHSVSGNTGNGGTGATGGASAKHRHGSETVDQNLDGLTQTVMNYADDTPDHTHTGPSHNHSISLTSGSGGTGNTGTANPPYGTANYIIYTGVGQ